MTARWFAEDTKLLAIRDIALGWSKELGNVAPHIIERSIIEWVEWARQDEHLNTVVFGDDDFGDGPTGPDLLVSQEVISQYCLGDLPWPHFWFGDERAPWDFEPLGGEESADPQQQCEEWLRQFLSEVQPGQYTRDQLQKTAQEKFARLSGRAYTRAWANAAPPEFKRAGRHRKASRRRDTRTD